MLVPGDATLWTIGHSTRTWHEFLGLLREHDIERLADVRHYPSSGRVPWTNEPALSRSLADAGIEYGHLVDLGGYRKPNPDSENRAWRNAAFRGYADHMRTEAFRIALDRLIALAREERTATMCAEAMPWRCHRSLLSDALVVRGVRVIHILSAGKTRDHGLTPFAKVRGGFPVYPAAKGKG